MANIFSEVQDTILCNENIMFEENKIKDFLWNSIKDRVELETERQRPFLFEEIVHSFFEYRHIRTIKTKKTRDFGLDGIIKLNLQLIGEIDLGLQIKYKIIDSNDIDLFLSALRNTEIQLGIIVCKDSRRLEKYELNSKIKAILFSKGININDKIIKEKIDVNPVLVLKMKDIIEMAASEIRSIVVGVYKK